jgi:hypothetical protein
MTGRKRFIFLHLIIETFLLLNSRGLNRNLLVRELSPSIKLNVLLRNTGRRTYGLVFR